MKLGDRPTWVRSSATRSRFSLRVRASPKTSRGSATMSATLTARAQRSVRILKHHLGLAAHLPHLAPRQRVDVRALEEDASLASPRSGAAAAGRSLTCRSPIRRRRATVSPRWMVEGHAVDRAHVGAGLAEREAADPPEGLAEVLGPDERLGHWMASAVTQHAAVCCSPKRNIGGISPAHLSIRNEQRE